MANYNFKDLETVVYNWTTQPINNGFTAQTISEVIPELAIGPKVNSNNVTMIAGGTEMLKVAEDGFYVRGIKIPADEKEAETVYNAFKQFLVWAELHRQ